MTFETVATEDIAPARGFFMDELAVKEDVEDIDPDRVLVADVVADKEDVLDMVPDIPTELPHTKLPHLSCPHIITPHPYTIALLIVTAPVKTIFDSLPFIKRAA